MLTDPRIVFLHANGYPAGAYRQFILALSRYAAVEAPEIIESPPGLAPTQRWPTMVNEIVDLIRQQRRPFSFVGHSMGGYLSLMAGARHRGQLQSVVLIDSPVVTGWRSALLRSVQKTGFADRVGPAPIAARRKHQWENREQARQFFLTKPFVTRWAVGVIDDFLEHALVQTPDGRVRLRIAREIESDIYAYLPTGRAAQAYRQLEAAGIPVYLIAGTRSEEIDLGGRRDNMARFGSRYRAIDTAHLIPLEAPDACASLVADCLQSGARIAA